MTMERLDEPERMTDRVFVAIRDQIMKGSMPAGYRLRVRDIAEQVGTSVMPVREAILRLEEAGLAERFPHRGAVVKALSLTELRDVYAVRTLLEVEATRLGAAGIDPSSLDLMQRECDALVGAVAHGDVVGAVDGDEALLRALYRAAGNPVLLDLIEGLWRRCRAYKLMGARGAMEADREALSSFQARLVEALREGRTEHAVGVAEASLRAALSRIEAQLQEASSAAPAR